MVEGHWFMQLPFISGDEVWVLRNMCRRTVSGQECSSTKVDFVCAVRVPGGVNCRGNVHGYRIRSYPHGFHNIGEFCVRIESFTQQERCMNSKMQKNI